MITNTKKTTVTATAMNPGTSIPSYKEQDAKKRVIYNKVR